MNLNKTNNYESMNNKQHLKEFNSKKNLKKSSLFYLLLTFFIVVFFVLFGIMITFLAS